MKAESLIVVSGVSGSGKSTALNALEDLGFYCVDNLPLQLIEPFIRLLQALPDSPPDLSALAAGIRPDNSKHFALLVNCYDSSWADRILGSLGELRESGVPVTVLFFDAQDEVILRRYQQTRRSHPLVGNRAQGVSLADALAEERRLLSDFREAATRVFDTTSCSPHELRRLVADYVGQQFELEVRFVSFGFKFGIPTDADLVLDVRFLPNPHFDPQLQPRTGLDAEVADYVFQGGEAEELTELYLRLLRFLLPKYKAEGKRYLTVAIGCTGGRHRSVAVSERLSKSLQGLGIRIHTHHRDCER